MFRCTKGTPSRPAELQRYWKGKGDVRADTPSTPGPTHGLQVCGLDYRRIQLDSTRTVWDKQQLLHLRPAAEAARRLGAAAGGDR